MRARLAAALCVTRGQFTGAMQVAWNVLRERVCRQQEAEEMAQIERLHRVQLVLFLIAKKAQLEGKEGAASVGKTLPCNRRSHAQGVVAVDCQYCKEGQRGGEKKDGLREDRDDNTDEGATADND